MKKNENGARFANRLYIERQQLKIASLLIVDQGDGWAASAGIQEANLAMYQLEGYNEVRYFNRRAIS